MKARKKGHQYEIVYRCPGYKKPFYERFATMEEANLRIAQIELDKSRGELRPPKELLLKAAIPKATLVTVRQLMDEFVQHYGLNHWGESYLSDNLHRIEHYINPYIGDVLLTELTPHDLDIFYDELQDKPAIILKGHTKTDARISPSVIQRIHVLLRSALNTAVRWGYIPTNPAEHVTPPEYHKKERLVWTAEEALHALECCKDRILRLAMLLALACSMRIGEILALQWDHVFCSDEDIEKGIDLFRQAAALGNDDAAREIALMYDTGRPGKKDPKEALSWYMKSAELGNAASANNAGTMYMNGEGTEKNYAEALRWFLKAAEGGDRDALQNLGVIYYTGNGAEKDMGKAAGYFAEAAKLGNIQAQYNLGIMYRDGEGVAKNLNAAAKLFSEACTAGYQDACRELGEGRPE